jgi:hypothetical protein
VYIARRVSAHFWIPKNGRPVQHVDTAVRAWHGVAHNAYGIGVETEGCGAPPHNEPLTINQLTWFARLMSWANKVHGIPLQLSEAVTTPGLNYHRAKGGPATGCPCDVRLNSRAEILRLARAVGEPVAPTPTPTPEPELFGGGLPVFILTNIMYPGTKERVMLECVYGGKDTYWREVAQGMRGNVPKHMVIDDPNGSWRQRWRVAPNPA